MNARISRRGSLSEKRVKQWQDAVKQRRKELFKDSIRVRPQSPYTPEVESSKLLLDKEE